jgi:hypothetical protein
LCKMAIFQDIAMPDVLHNYRLRQNCQHHRRFCAISGETMKA